MFFKLYNYLWIGGDYADTYNSQFDGEKDWFYGNGGNDIILGDDSTDHIFGGADNDWLQGNGGDDFLYGGTGDDVMYGGEGADYLDGGSGEDTVFYKSSPTGVNVNLSTGQGSGGYAEGDVLNSIEHISGSQKADVLIGSAAANTIKGHIGSDTIDGGGGDDHIFGGNNDTGSTPNELGDILTGGLGADKFYYYADSGGDQSVDFITDFGNGDDMLIFYELGNPYQFTGEQTGFQTSGSEVWFRTYDNVALGTVTEVNVRIDQYSPRDPSDDVYMKIILNGDVDLTANDFAFI